MTRWFLALAIPVLAASSACSLWMNEPECAACHRPLHPQTSFQVTLDSGEVQHLCCPRCGLHFSAHRNDVAKMQAADYQTGELIPAEEAFYVENSEVMLCCRLDKLARDRSGGVYGLDWDRCLPSLVAFSTREGAKEFQRQKGGEIKTLDQIRSEPDFSSSIVSRHP